MFVVSHILKSVEVWATLKVIRPGVFSWRNELPVGWTMCFVTLQIVYMTNSYIRH